MTRSSLLQTTLMTRPSQAVCSGTTITFQIGRYFSPTQTAHLRLLATANNFQYKTNPFHSGRDLLHSQAPPEPDADVGVEIGRK